MANPACESDAAVPYPFGGCLLAEETYLKEGICRWLNVFQDNPAFTLFFDFDKDLIKETLDIEGCKGIRIFPVIDKGGKMNVMIVAKNTENNEITNAEGKITHIDCCGQNGESRFYNEKVKDKCE
ncbi:hypothetical protein IC229_14255 [Spirosoma sp. BT702]|uniref:Uncharacterized protein n=1 Tax=Spirosoma profusum TaxID=2771354 RepID=A0A926Y3E8_9BACT|nr:hypothetical protein [Spirosoma profusum]MBD2701810.1 hypothetical protein [Spirosoma profusum]